MDGIGILEIDYISPPSLNEDSIDIIDEVYNNKLNWTNIEDNHLFTFRDSTNAIMKKFQLLPNYCNKDIVQTIEKLKAVCTDTKNPREISVVLPMFEFFVDITNRASTTLIIFDNIDCANIMKVAKNNFQMGDRLDNGVECFFSFGEMVYDTVNKETAVIVGHTKKRVYAISCYSRMQCYRRRADPIPYARSCHLMRKVCSSQSLNFRIVKECADLDEFIVPNSERAYDF